MADLKKMQPYAALNVNLSRQNYGPLDVSNVFYSEAAFKWYLKFSSVNPQGPEGAKPAEVGSNFVGYPYEGQIIAVENEGKVTVYVLGPELAEAKADGTYFNYEEVGAKTLGDGDSIDLDETTGELSIHGFADAQNKQVPYKDIATGKLIWGDISGLIPGAVIPVSDGETINVVQDTTDTSKYIVSIKGKDGALNNAVLRKHINGTTVTYTWDVMYSAAETDALLEDKVDKESGKSLIETSKITKLDGISEGANKVEHSDTNGNIKIDGVETTVYTEVAGTVHDAQYKHITVAADGNSVSDGTNTLNISSLKTDVAAIQSDYLKAADKTELAGDITDEATVRAAADTTLGNRITPLETAVAGLDTRFNAKLDADKVGVAGGVAQLDDGGKVPVAQLPDVVLGQLLFGGTLGEDGVATVSANLKSLLKLGTSENTIQLVDRATDDKTKSPKEFGYKTLESVYFISDADWTVGSLVINKGDWILSIGNAWKKVDNSDAVTGVKGEAESSYRIGNVNITKANIGLGNVTDGAQVNVIEQININGTKVDPVSKVVSITVPTGAMADKDKVAKSDLATELAEDLDAKATNADLNTAKGRITALETVVGDSGSGLVKGLADETTARTNADSALDTRIAVYETNKTGYDDAVAKKHAHANKDVLDTVTAEVVSNSHTHTNKATLDAITSTVKEGYDAAVTKVAGIEAGAQVNKIESIKLNGATVTISNKEVDLGNLATKAQLDTVDGKVDQVETDLEAEVTRATGAEATIQADVNTKLAKDDLATEVAKLTINSDKVSVGTDKTLTTKLSEVDTSISNLNTNKADASTVTALAGRVSTAEADIDTLQAASHTHSNKDILDGIAAKNLLTDAQITAINNVANKADKTYVDGQLENKQDKLSSLNKLDADYIKDGETNKVYTATEKTKLGTVEENAEKNIIETVKVDNVALTPDANRAVNIDLTGKQDKLTAGDGINITNNTIKLDLSEIVICGGTASLE